MRDDACWRRLARDELGDVLSRGAGGRLGGFAPCLVERAFAHVLGLARDAELIAIGAEHDPDDDDVSLPFAAGVTRTVPCTS